MNDNNNKINNNNNSLSLKKNNYTKNYMNYCSKGFAAPASVFVGYSILFN